MGRDGRYDGDKVFHEPRSPMRRQQPVRRTDGWRTSREVSVIRIGVLKPSACLWSTAGRCAMNNESNTLRDRAGKCRRRDKEFTMSTMRLKKLAAGSAIIALGFGALGGAGFAQAKPHDPGPCIPGIDCWVPGDPPGHNPFGPPGQVMQGNVPGADLAAPELVGVPPGHWGEPWLYGLPATWRPWDRGDIPFQPVVWNPDLVTWGIWWADQFIPFTS